MDRCEWIAQRTFQVLGVDPGGVRCAFPPGENAGRERQSDTTTDLDEPEIDLL
jgi:hypothetical protein